MRRDTKKKLMALVAAVLMAIASYFGMDKQVVKPVVDTAVEVGSELAFPDSATATDAPVKPTSYNPETHVEE